MVDPYDQIDEETLPFFMEKQYHRQLIVDSAITRNITTTNTDTTIVRDTTVTRKNTGAYLEPHTLSKDTIATTINQLLRILLLLLL